MTCASKRIAFCPTRASVIENDLSKKYTCLTNMKRGREHDLHLKRYYAECMPVDTLFAWMNQANCADQLECALFFENGVKRYVSVESNMDLRELLIVKCPLRMEIGPIYTHTPTKKQIETREYTNKIEGKPFVLDLDLSDYDGLRKCCVEKDICGLCWPFISAACKVLNRKMRENFGFEKVYWVFSGRRGVHCWVWDNHVLPFDAEMRSAILENIKQSVIPSEMEKDRETLAPYFDVLRDLHQIESTDPLVIYPRLDEKVTTDMKHLLKAPFCIHPSTGLVCVPFLPDQEFCPFDVPSCNQVVENPSLLVPYFQIFDTQLTK